MYNVFRQFLKFLKNSRLSQVVLCLILSSHNPALTLPCFRWTNVYLITHIENCSHVTTPSRDTCFLLSSAINTGFSVLTFKLLFF